MQISNMQIVNYINGLSELIGEAPNICVKNSHRINRNLRRLTEAYAPYEEDRNKIIESEKSDEEKMEAQKELLETKTDVAIDMIPLCDLENEPLNLKQMNILDFMVKDTEQG